jgi:ATP-dependent DNA helicase RecG
MKAFSNKEIDVLISTTVIEVGVDIPNATVMVIMDADRFGVSQLHQLRGRVGRGTSPGLCLLVTSALADTPARERLEAVAGTTDGFELSRIDLEQRREGDVLGASQSGSRSHLRLLRVLRDESMIEQAREDASRILDEGINKYSLLEAELSQIQADAAAEFIDKA